MNRLPFRRAQRPKPRTLDQAQIVRAALALLDENGLDELTMRRVAERLGVKAASLYRHVRSKEELLALLGDEITSAIPLPPTTGTWRQRLTEAAWNVRRGLAAHRDAARVLASTAPAGPRRLRHVEAVLRILREAGLNDRDVVRTAYHFNNLVTEFAADEGRFASFAGHAGVTRRRVLAEVRRQFQSLPRDEYPTIVALADELTDDAQDALFTSGIDLMLRAIEALANPDRSENRQRTRPSN